jgi:superfamily II DNA or RNA helicase
MPLDDPTCPPSSWELNWFQDEDVRTLTERKQSWAGIYGTGGGKTLLGLSVLQTFLDQQDIDLGIIVVPSDPIRNQWASHSGSRVITQDGSSIVLDEIHEARSTKGFKDLIKRKVRLIVLTHVLLLRERLEMDEQGHRITQALSGLDLTRVMIVFDEAQSVPYLSETKTAKHETARLEQSLLARGVTVGKLTATPEREDGQLVVPEDVYLTVERDLEFLMSEGLCPRQVTSEVVYVEGGGFDDQDGCMNPLDPIKGGQAVWRVWVEHGRPPGMTRIKPVRSTRANQKAVREIAKAAGEESHRVIDTTGDQSESSDFYLKLRAESQAIREGRSDPLKRPKYEDCQTMYVGMQRIIAGVDSVSRSFGVLYGLPRSSTLFRQFVGRFMRVKFYADGTLKVEGYPDKWVDRVHIVLLVGGTRDETARNEAHMELLFRMVATLQALHAAGLDRDLFRQFYDGLRKGRGGKPRKKVVTERLHHIKLMAEAFFKSKETPLDAGWYFDLNPATKVDRISCWMQVERENQTLLEDALKVLGWLEPLSEEEILGMGHLILGPVYTGQKAQVADLLEAYRMLYEEFKDSIVKTDDGAAWSMDHTFIEYFRVRGQDINKGLPGPLESLEVLRGRVERFLAIHGRYPSLSDRDPEDPRFEFADHHKHLRSGRYSGFGFRGDLGEWVTEWEGRPWWETALEIARDLATYLHPKKGELRDQFLSSGDNLLSRIRGYFGRVAVACYYPHAVLFTQICSDPNALSGLSVREADKLGKLPKAERLEAVKRLSA